MATENKKSEDQLDVFLNGFQELTQQITQAALENSDDADEKSVIQGFSNTVVNQVTELNQFIRGGMQKSSRQQKVEVGTILKLTSGATLTKDARGVLGSIGSLIGKLGIAKIIQEIKKIVRTILEEIFNISLPKWLDALLLLIDEIFHAILSGGSSKTATLLSIQEQNYQAELVGLAKQQQANQFKHREERDEE